MIAWLRFLDLLPVLRRLGVGALAAVAVYRAACRWGVYSALLPLGAAAPGGRFFDGTSVSPSLPLHATRRLLAHADALLAGEYTFFSKSGAQIDSPPDWFLDPFRDAHVKQAGHWSQYQEFAAGDIKIIWELSRFEWSPLLAQAWQVSGDDRYLVKLNQWLQDWVRCNPPNTGPNWKCAQEASIRLVNLLLTARILGTHREPSRELADLVTLHCRRIRPTIRYARAQNNNHGTSEAAALFIGGAWLVSHADRTEMTARARGWRDKGRQMLEERVAKLIEEDGSFSQYSVNYHRVLVDTLNQVEFWRRELGAAHFSDKLHRRCSAAIQWLAALTDSLTGDAPNLGANDGARLYNLSTTPYRDYRPSVQLGTVLFDNVRVYGDGGSDEPLTWLGLHGCPIVQRAATSRPLRDGGYVVIRKGAARGLVRAPNFRFRPSHADALHLDLWHRGENILRDGGTYSYNTEPRWLDYFSGTASHNTVQFDGRDQMPRLGRFLFGTWLKMDEFGDLKESGRDTSWSGAYTDYRGCRHRRTVAAGERVWKVTDELRGFREQAVLRWRLIPGEWRLEGQVCTSSWARIEVQAEGSQRRMELVTGWESRHYLEKTELPVLEFELGPGEARFTTAIELRG